MLRVRIDESKCIAAGACVLASPEVFDQREDDGVVVLLSEHPDERLHASVRAAAAACPAKVIEVVED